MKFKYWTRRIVALMFSVCGAGVLSYLALQGNKEALVALVAMTSSIITFYFVTRAES